MGDLETFFNETWSIFDVLEMNFGDDGRDVEGMQRFLIGVQSPFYPDIGELYRRRIDEWAADRRRESGVDEPDDEASEATDALESTNG